MSSPMPPSRAWPGTAGAASSVIDVADSDAAAVGAEQQRLAHRGPPSFLTRKSGTASVVLDTGAVRAHADADAYVQAIGPALVDSQCEAEWRVFDLDQRQPRHAGFGAAVGAAQRGIDERDQRRALRGDSTASSSATPRGRRTNPGSGCRRE